MHANFAPVGSLIDNFTLFSSHTAKHFFHVPDGMRDENIAMPGNETCGSLQKYFSTIEAVSNKCLEAVDATGTGLSAYCCPREDQTPCDFCNGGVTAPDTVTFPDPGRSETRP